MPAATTRRRTVTALAPLLALTLAAGCGSDSKKGAAPTAAATTGTAAASGAAALLPADVKAAGVLKVASDESYAPIDFFGPDGTTIMGIDYDLGQALGAKLGVKLEFSNQQFDGIIPSLVAKRFDLVMSAMTDNKKRQGMLDFVDYFTAGTSIVVKKGNPEHITDFAGLCGKAAGAEKGTTQVDDVLTGESKKCVAAGKPAIMINALPKDTDVLLAVKSGKLVADVNDSPVAAYNAAKTGDLEAVLSQAEGTAPYGIGVLKGRDDLVKAVQAALKEVVADGSYAKILAKYGADAGALTTAAVNGGS